MLSPPSIHFPVSGRLTAIGALLVTALAPPALAASAGAGAQQPPAQPEVSLFDPTPESLLRDMDTDRPNHVNTPHTVDAGHLQIEVGLADVTRQWDEASATSLTTGEINLRLGVLANVKLNLAIAAFETTPNGSGFGDTVAGAKVNLWGDAGSDTIWATALAVQPQVTFPTAGSTRGTGYVEAVLNLPASINLPHDVHLGLQLTPGIIRNEHNTAYVGGLQEAASLDRVLFAKTDFYIEYWAANAPQTRPQQTLDAGFTVPLGRNVVADSGAFFGLNRASVSFEFAAGVSVRF